VVKDPEHVRKLFAREPGGPAFGLAGSRQGPCCESQGSTTAMNGRGKSDSPVIPGKLPNKGGGAPQPAEEVEGRGLAKGNPARKNRSRTQRRRGLQHELGRIRQATSARQYPRQEPSAVVPLAGICVGGSCRETGIPTAIFVKNKAGFKKMNSALFLLRGNGLAQRGKRRWKQVNSFK